MIGSWLLPLHWPDGSVGIGWAIAGRLAVEGAWLAITYNEIKALPTKSLWEFTSRNNLTSHPT